jgi:hypothetical protein
VRRSMYLKRVEYKGRGRTGKCWARGQAGVGQGLGRVVDTGWGHGWVCGFSKLMVPHTKIVLIVIECVKEAAGTVFAGEGGHDPAQ